MGSEPIESEIPISFEDLSVHTQQALYIHSILPGRFGEMSGVYLGKDLSSLPSFFNILDIEKDKWLLILDLVSECNNITLEVMANKKATKTPKK